MKLPIICEPVDPPCALADSRMSALTATLRTSGYDMPSCAARLGSFPRLGVNFWDQMRPQWIPNPTDPVDAFIELFIDSRPLPVDRLRSLTSTSFVDAICETGLVHLQDGMLQPKLSLFPISGLYIVTDRAARNPAINQVMWLWGESYLLAGLVNRMPRLRGIDLGTGSGVHALLASRHCQSVIAGDISSRSLDFGRFNAALNGCRNVDFVLSDVLNNISGSADLLIANPPYAPDSAAKAGENFWSGGLDGWDLTKRIVGSLPERLEDGGVLHMNSLYPNTPGTTIREHFDGWIEGGTGRYEVLDHTWAIPEYEDALSEGPYEGDKSAWRFGVVSIRRSASGPGYWLELGKRGAFFRADGSCTTVADHDAIPRNR